MLKNNLQMGQKAEQLEGGDSFRRSDDLLKRDNH